MIRDWFTPQNFHKQKCTTTTYVYIDINMWNVKSVRTHTRNIYVRTYIINMIWGCMVKVVKTMYISHRKYLYKITINYTNFYIKILLKMYMRARTRTSVQGLYVWGIIFNLCCLNTRNQSFAWPKCLDHAMPTLCLHTIHATHYPCRMHMRAFSLYLKYMFHHYRRG